MTDTTHPPAETLAECPFCGADAVWREDDPAKPSAVFGLVVDHSSECFLRWSSSVRDDQSIRAAWNRRAALTRRAGGDAGTIDRCIEKLEQTARWSINDGRKWFNHPAANEAFEYAIAALRTVEPNAGGDAIPAVMTAEWCLNMARLEEGQEVGAGMPDHPLRLKCELPPAGWLCTREPGHAGPCAATPKPTAGGDAGEWQRAAYASIAANAAATKLIDRMLASLGHMADGLADQKSSWADYARRLFTESQDTAHADRLAALALPAPVVEGEHFANDEAAKALYDTWSNQPGWVPWVERGNSTMQERARREVTL